MTDKSSNVGKTVRLIGHWVGYKLTYISGIIFISIFLLILLLSGYASPDSRLLGLLSYSPFLIIGAALFGIRNRLHLAERHLIVGLSFLSIPLKTWRYPLTDFTRIELFVTSPPSDMYGKSVNIYDIRVGGRGKTHLRINMFAPPGGCRGSKRGLKSLLEFAKELSGLTKLRVQYDSVVREDMRRFGLE